MIKRCYECLHWKKGIATEMRGKCVRFAPQTGQFDNTGKFPVTLKDDHCGEFSGRGIGSEMYGYAKPSIEIDRLIKLIEEDE